MAREKRQRSADSGDGAAPRRAAAPASKRLEAMKRRRLAKTFLAYPDTPGYAFTFGTGEFGALGLGEDTTEKLRPAHVDVDGKRLLSVVSAGAQVPGAVQGCDRTAVDAAWGSWCAHDRAVTPAAVVIWRRERLLAVAGGGGARQQARGGRHVRRAQRLVVKCSGRCDR
jgi:hypothetical protein